MDKTPNVIVGTQVRLKLKPPVAMTPTGAAEGEAVPLFYRIRIEHRPMGHDLDITLTIHPKDNPGLACAYGQRDIVVKEVAGRWRRPERLVDVTIERMRLALERETGRPCRLLRATLPDADDEPKTDPPPLVFDVQPSGLYTLRRD